MSAEIPDPVPTVGVSTQPALSGASFAAPALGPPMTDAWVRQSHTPPLHSNTAATAHTPRGVSDHHIEIRPGFPPHRRRLSVLGHFCAYKAAAVSCAATNCTVNDFLTAYDAAQFPPKGATCLHGKETLAAAVCDVL